MTKKREVGERNNLPHSTCRLCGDDMWVEYLYEKWGVCPECIDIARNLYAKQHSGRYETWPDEAADAVLAKVYRKQKIPPELRWDVWERDNFTCRKCGSRKHLHVDHIVPERHGGEMTIDNLQTLCKPCNSRKKDRVE